MDNCLSVGNISNKIVTPQTDTLAGSLHGRAKALSGREGGCPGFSGTTVLGSWFEISCTEGLEEQQMATKIAMWMFNPALAGARGSLPRAPTSCISSISVKNTLSKNWRLFIIVYCDVLILHIRLWIMGLFETHLKIAEKLPSCLILCPYAKGRSKSHPISFSEICHNIQ